MAAIGKVSLKGIKQDDFTYTFLGKTGDFTRANEGISAVSIDTTAANQVKMAADAERILGRMEIYEDRVAEGIKTCAVSLSGTAEFTVKLSPSGAELPAVGDFLVGAGGGFVRKATTVELAVGTKANWQVIEMGPSNLTVIAIKV